MNFHKYPHDEQLCKMSMESCKYSNYNTRNKKIEIVYISVSHTTEDLVFEWLPEDDTPLVVDEGIELPQLELIQNFTSDCTTNYSTGSFTCLEVVFRFKRRLGWVYCHKEANKDYNFYTNSRNLYNLYILGTSCFTPTSQPV